MTVRSHRAIGTTTRRLRLGFELLERRDLLAVMRIVDWNTLNGPNDATDAANFQTILEAIGNENVAGNSQRIDILALQETDPVVSGNDSIGQVATVLNSIYPTANYQYFVSTADGGGDSTGFVYDTTTVSLLNAIEVSGSLTHSISRGKFQPVGTVGDNDFYLYSIHLKSGSTPVDAATRGSEAGVLRADADALSEGAHVLFVGDFNMKTSGEAAYSAIVAPGAGQLFDVADASGNWFDNPAFKSLHTQDPRPTTPTGPGSGMDDRFDIQFASGEFFDGVGLEYVANSYHVFGNNGTHTFDGPITTGTGASPAVLAALAAASDHLPVVADYEFPSAPRVRIIQTLGGTKVVEGGLYDTYHVVLDTVPSSNVTVTVTPSGQIDLGSGAGVARVLMFTPSDAFTPQTIVVRGADDAVGEGDHTGSITHTAASADAAYNGLTIAGVMVAIVDDDAPKIVINEIDSDQSGADAAEFIELYDGGVGNVSLSGYVLVFFNGGDPNNASYFRLDLADKQTDANGFFLIANSALIPMPGTTNLVFANNTLQNGADAVALYFASPSLFPNGTPPTSTNLRDAIVYDTSDADDVELIAALTSNHPQINEDGNGMGTTQSLARLPDGGALLDTAQYAAQSPTPGMFNTTHPFGIEFLQSGARLEVFEGGEIDTYQIALQSIPTANVQITIDPDNETDLGAGPGAAIALTFTPANALIPQSVTVAAIDDAAVEGQHTSTIAHTAASSDPRYNGLTIGNVVANIVDNDIPPPPFIAITEIMYNPATDEGGASSPEWLEVINAGAGIADLSGWKFDDEDSTNWGPIPNGTLLNPGQIAVFFDAEFTTPEAFRSDWGVPAGALVLGVAWGSLSNSPSSTNEVLQLVDSLGIAQDTVNYDDTNPWPSGADGPSIYLKSLAADNNDGSNWARSTTAARAVAPSGATYSAADLGSPGRFFLAGDYTLNGVVDAADFVVWRETLGSTTDLAADGSGPTPGVPDGIVDSFDYAWWRANFGAIGVPEGGQGSGAGVGQLTFSPSVSEAASLRDTQSAFVLVATGSGEAGAIAATDAAVSLVAIGTARFSPQSARVLSSPTPTSGADRASLLLDRSGATSSASDDDMDFMLRDDDAGIDEAFASLDFLDLTTPLGRVFAQ